jgi:hypothetical protein
MLTPKQAVQCCIDDVKFGPTRRVLQRRFDRNPDQFTDEVVARIWARSTPEEQAALEAGGMHAIDPAKLEKWKEIFKILLQIFLALA